MGGLLAFVLWSGLGGLFRVIQAELLGRSCGFEFDERVGYLTYWGVLCLLVVGGARGYSGFVVSGES